MSDEELATSPLYLSLLFAISSKGLMLLLGGLDRKTCWWVVNTKTIVML